jgi:2,3,4,5-tetrahydropyridine-2,6-dicarboxylate N-succinyltransferase
MLLRPQIIRVALFSPLKNHAVHKSRIEKGFAGEMSVEDPQLQESLTLTLRALEKGIVRVASPCGKGPFQDPQSEFPMHGDLREWDVHAWIKQAILLSFRWRRAKVLGASTMPQSRAGMAVDFGQYFLKEDQGRVHQTDLCYFDKFDIRSDLGEAGVRVVPPGVVREGAFVGAGCIVMPGFVNVGAYVSKGSMVDTWATVGSCAQIGKNVHLAGGVGIGGVLEPAGARPVLVGDDAFIGSRAIVVEGAVIGNRAVLGANTCVTASTPVIDVTTAERKEHRGYVPAGAVVAPGTRAKSFPGGEVQLQCAYIIGWRSERTDAKVSLNDVLRETGISV